VLTGIGLQDDVCPPSTSFMTYNLIESEKQYDIYKFEKHAQPASHYEDRFA
jgi:cephalosporin-C deacetylase-like acetyl esterase